MTVTLAVTQSLSYRRSEDKEPVMQNLFSHACSHEVTAPTLTSAVTITDYLDNNLVKFNVV